MCKLMSSRLSPFIALRCFTAFMPQSLTRTEEEASDLSVTCGGAHPNFYCFSKGGGNWKAPIGRGTRAGPNFEGPTVLHKVGKSNPVNCESFSFFLSNLKAFAEMTRAI